MERSEFLAFADEVGAIYDELEGNKREKLWKMTEFFDNAEDDKKRRIAEEILKVARKWRDEK